MLQFASSIKNRNSLDLEKGKREEKNTAIQFLILLQPSLLDFLLSCQHLSLSEEEEEEEEEESDEESGEIVLQSSSLSRVNEEKEVTEPPAKQPRTNLNVHTPTHSTPH